MLLYKDLFTNTLVGFALVGQVIVQSEEVGASCDKHQSQIAFTYPCSSIQYRTYPCLSTTGAIATPSLEILRVTRPGPSPKAKSLPIWAQSLKDPTTSTFPSLDFSET